MMRHLIPFFIEALEVFDNNEEIIAEEERELKRLFAEPLTEQEI